MFHAIPCDGISRVSFPQRAMRLLSTKEHCTALTMRPDGTDQVAIGTDVVQGGAQVPHDIGTAAYGGDPCETHHDTLAVRTARAVDPAIGDVQPLHAARYFGVQAPLVFWIVSIVNRGGRGSHKPDEARE